MEHMDVGPCRELLPCDGIYRLDQELGVFSADVTDVRDIQIVSLEEVAQTSDWGLLANVRRDYDVNDREMVFLRRGFSRPNRRMDWSRRWGIRTRALEDLRICWTARRRNMWVAEIALDAKFGMEGRLQGCDRNG
jgi:hypothetical protein